MARRRLSHLRQVQFSCCVPGIVISLSPHSALHSSHHSLLSPSGKTLTASTGCFSKFPKSVPEPPEKPSEKEEGKERPVFIPSHPAKSMRQRSIMFRNM